VDKIPPKNAIVSTNNNTRKSKSACLLPRWRLKSNYLERERSFADPKATSRTREQRDGCCHGGQSSRCQWTVMCSFYPQLYYPLPAAEKFIRDSQGKLYIESGARDTVTSNLSSSCRIQLSGQRTWTHFSVFRRVRKFQKTTVSFVKSVGLSAWNNSASTGPVFMKFDMSVFFENLLMLMKNSDAIIVNRTRDPPAFGAVP